MNGIEVTIKKNIPVKYLRARMGVRYWEDAKVNGVPDDDDNPKMPLQDGDCWCIEIDLDTGKITGWPEGVTADTHYKVCDSGTYTAIDHDGNNVISIDDYVPSMLAPEGNHYGDYVIMKIDRQGVIQNFEPDLSFFNPDEE